MRTVHLLTISHSILFTLGGGGLPNPLDADPLGGRPPAMVMWPVMQGGKLTPPPCEQNDTQV